MTAHGDVDLRGFSYALAPVQRQAQWQLELLRRKLGSLQREVAAAEELLAQLRQAHMQHASDLVQQWRQRIDLARHAQGLAFLGQCGTRIAGQAKHLAARRELLAGVQRECMQAQLRVQGMARHEQDAICQFSAEQRRRLAVEADRDWAGRAVARRGASEVHGHTVGSAP